MIEGELGKMVKWLEREKRKKHMVDEEDKEKGMGRQTDKEIERVR